MSIYLFIYLFYSTANAKRGGLTRLHSFHRTTQDQVQSVDVGTNEQRTLDAKQTDSEVANVANSANSAATEDLSVLPYPETSLEQKDGHVPCVTKLETQLINKGEERIESTTDPQIPLQRPVVMVSGQFTADVSSPDSQANPFVSYSLPTVDASNPLSPFIPKKKSMEEKRPISDLIQFGDNVEPDVNKLDTAVERKESVSNVAPFEDVRLTEEAHQTKGIERSLLNVRQPSMESDHSVVCAHVLYHLLFKTIYDLYTAVSIILLYFLATRKFTSTGSKDMSVQLTLKVL